MDSSILPYLRSSKTGNLSEYVDYSTYRYCGQSWVVSLDPRTGFGWDEGA